MGYAGVGISFGIVASSQNFSIFNYLVMYLCRGCYAIYYVRVVYSRYTDISDSITVFIVNSRMFLFGLSLAPNFKTYGF
ncbi:AzlC family ABC transporter permease [Staphylococcus aureus]